MKTIFKAFLMMGLMSSLAQAISNTDSIEKVLVVKDGSTYPEVLAIGHKGSYTITCSGFFGVNEAQLWFNQSINLSSLESNKINLDVSITSRQIVVKKNVKTFEECTLMKATLESATSPKNITINSATDFEVR